MAADESDDDRTRSFVNLAAGTEVSHYKIISKIGAGGMGEVYLAEDTQLDRKVAMKFLPPHLSQDEAARARFTREAKAAAKLDHPNIVPVHEVGEFQGRPFFAMAHIDGKSLREVIKEGKIPVTETIELAKQICEGLNEAHNAGVIHRDIKPGNIIIDSKGKPRILDFGLATIAGEDKLTKTGSTLGTAGYMSPEQIEGKKVDHRSDIFSVGVILYEMLTNRRPFEGDTDAAISHAITTSTPEPIARYKSGTTGEVQQIVDKALQKDPSLRYQHADEILADLCRLSSPAGSGSRRSRRRVGLIVASLSLLCAVIAFVIFRPWQWFGEPLFKSGSVSARIVIVPFRNQTGDSTFNALGRMASDWTSQSLVRTGLAEVVPAEALSGLSNTQGVKAIVDATGANILVTGSYYRFVDSIQFQAQIIGADEKLIHAIEPVSCSPAEMDKAVNLLRQRILGALAVVLDRKLLGTITGGSSPPTYEAYQEYNRGFDAFHIRSDWKDAIEHFKQAYLDDTSFLEPLVESCPAYGNLHQFSQEDSLLKFLNQRYSRLNHPQQLAVDLFSDQLAGNYTKALDDCKQLAQLLPGSHASFQLGFLAVIKNLPHEAIDAFKTVNPDAGWAQYWPLYWVYYAMAYHMLGNHKKEIELVREGKRRFPNNAWIHDVEIIALAALGRIDELKKVIEEYTILYEAGKATEFTPGDGDRDAADELNAHGYKDAANAMYVQAIEWYKHRPPDEQMNLRFSLAVTLFDAKRWDEAGNLVRQLVKESPDNMNYKAYAGLIAAHEGDKKTALQVFEWLQNLKRPYLFGGNTYQCARIAAVLGEGDQAVALLKEACAQGFVFVGDVHTDSAFETLRDYPPLTEFLRPKG